jgi:alkanesulfonate monooxygenase SsuD/methylene tetrahydromethanopterin reductase-like flavin-dependent oxidoreductase (luciferase family)
LNHPLQFGLAGLSGQSVTGDAQTFNVELKRTLLLAEAAESVGFDSVWATEHHFSPDGYNPSPLVLLAAISSLTQKVMLGTNIALAPLYQPLRLAEDAAVVDQLSAGRLILGLGLGYRPEELAAFGIAPEARVSRLVTCVETLKMAWSPGRSATSPPGDAVPSVRPSPLSTGGPPIWLGAWVEAGVRRARRLGDGYIAPIGTPKDLTRRLEWLETERAMDGFPIAVSVNGFVSAERAWEKAAAGFEHVMRQYQDWYGASDDPLATGKGRLATVSKHQSPPHFVAGTPGACVQMLEPLARLLSRVPGGGPGHILIRLTYPGQSENDALASVRFFGTEVIPALRAAVLHQRSEPD